MAGSHAYGTNIETSDIDIRGIFCYPNKDRISLKKLPEEVSQDHPEDVKFYELEKYLNLALDCNPNILELFWSPKDCIKFCDGRMMHLLNHRRQFITTRVYHTHSGYSFAQIKKMRGQNKWINCEQPKDPPKLENFCYVIDADKMNTSNSQLVHPGRPQPLSEYKIQLDMCKVSSLEHVPNVYRLYLGECGPDYLKTIGVFINNQISCKSISEWEERNNFLGFLIFNEQAYEKAKRDHTNYWTWMKERNPHRWVSQEKGETDFDVKNAQHCIRLLMCCEHVYRTGDILVRFEGNDLEYLRNIRNGLFSYDHIMSDVEKRMSLLEDLHKENKLKLPREPNYKLINNLFRDVLFM